MSSCFIPCFGNFLSHIGPFFFSKSASLLPAVPDSPLAACGGVPRGVLLSIRSHVCCMFPSFVATLGLAKKSFWIFFFLIGNFFFGGPPKQVSQWLQAATTISDISPEFSWVTCKRLPRQAKPSQACKANTVDCYTRPRGILGNGR